jgi:hypothetical protein
MGQSAAEKREDRPSEKFSDKVMVYRVLMIDHHLARKLEAPDPKSRPVRTHPKTQYEHYIDVVETL